MYPRLQGEYDPVPTHGTDDLWGDRQLAQCGNAIIGVTGKRDREHLYPTFGWMKSVARDVFLKIMTSKLRIGGLLEIAKQRRNERVRPELREKT